ncbi:IclR family transcriptional regulator C-terminal domain-containing protein [Pseudarthrobacter equi]|uniref:IclR family transcriptional regulator n=1 Tax=Pseudarthrobacter equi TaxID=728066 RepID=UPI0028D37DE2|nr:IclR family transcriptional regulator C-terminal domain-containing protein [Pseudarthrobacter equi]
MDSSAEASSMAQGLRIVRLVVDREKSGRPLVGVSQLAAALSMDQSRVSRLAQELCGLGLLERRERGPFRAGPEYFSLAAALNTGWVLAARTELESLVSVLGLRARLSVRDGYRAILLRNSSNDSVPGSFVQPGMVSPVWCTGAGRALLWDLARPALEGLLQDVNFIGIGGPGAAHTVDGVWELMARDRQAGVVAAVEEFEHDVVELAVPVRDGSGEVRASLSVLGGPGLAERRDAAAALAAAAKRLSAGVVPR